MVFESLVADLLNKYLGDYVENLDKSQLNIGIWGGSYLSTSWLRYLTIYLFKINSLFKKYSNTKSRHTAYFHSSLLVLGRHNGNDIQLCQL